MFYKEMYQELVDHEEVYRRLHPRTSEIDLQVIKKSVYGKNPVQIGREIPCSEATVYRAIERVERFLGEELPAYLSNRLESVYIHNEIGFESWGLTSAAWKFYLFCISSHQNFNDFIDKKQIDEVLPGLRNKIQRERVLLELNNLSVIPRGNPTNPIKVFKYVTYANNKYDFEFTKEALPYYDLEYALLSSIMKQADRILSEGL